jgi:membrane protease YdiL (CAAX protease family)
MDVDSPETPPAAPPAVSAIPTPTISERAVALLEVILCSDYPTQLALGATFAAFGIQPLGADRSLQIGYVALLSLLDTVFLVGLMLLFMRTHGERPRDIFLGPVDIPREIRRGVPLSLLALFIAATVMLTIQVVAPWLHTVDSNPLQDLVRSPRDIALFGLVVVVAGGVREELQRAFLLRRFERSLGGARLGVVVTSTAFGAVHLLQGADAAIATGLLGAFWAIVYLRRRSAVAPMVSHAGFNLMQLTQFITFGR